MLTATQQHAVDEFAKSLSALGDDALIDTYRQAWEDHTEASAEGSDNIRKAYAKGLATEKAMQDRFPDYQSRYQLAIREPVCSPGAHRPNRAYRAGYPRAGERSSDVATPLSIGNGSRRSL